MGWDGIDWDFLRLVAEGWGFGLKVSSDGWDGAGDSYSLDNLYAMVASDDQDRKDG